MSPPSYHSPGSLPPKGSRIPDRVGARIGSFAPLEDRIRRGGLSYASRDYLCLDCIVPGDCDPASVLCLLYSAAFCAPLSSARSCRCTLLKSASVLWRRPAIRMEI